MSTTLLDCYAGNKSNYGEAFDLRNDIKDCLKTVTYYDDGTIKIYNGLLNHPFRLHSSNFPCPYCSDPANERHGIFFVIKTTTEKALKFSSNAAYGFSVDEEYVTKKKYAITLSKNL